MVALPGLEPGCPEAPVSKTGVYAIPPEGHIKLGAPCRSLTDHKGFADLRLNARLTVHGAGGQIRTVTDGGFKPPALPFRYARHFRRCRSVFFPRYVSVKE